MNVVDYVGGFSILLLKPCPGTKKQGLALEEASSVQVVRILFTVSVICSNVLMNKKKMKKKRQPQPLRRSDLTSETAWRI